MYETGEAVARAFFDCFNAQDADGLAALFVEDAEFVNVVGFWWRNRRQIRKAHDYGFRRIFQNAQIEITELSTRALSPDIHLIHTVSTLDEQTTLDGDETGPRIAVISMVAQRFDDGFKLVSCHNTDRVEGADTHIRDSQGFRAVSYQPTAE